MRRIKRFLKNNQWAILAFFGALTLMALFAELFIGAMNVIGFYVTYALI